jgi:regulator of protease activity HflC (stomatin/prohibitin superfamily)
VDLASVILLVLAALGALAAAWSIFRALFERVTVFEYERALKYDRGRFVGVVGPGQSWIYRRRTTLQKIDIRPSFVSVPGQEVLSSDGVTLRVSLAAEYELADPAVAVNEVEDYQAALYLTLQLGLREIVGGTEIDELLERRGQLGAQLTELTKERVASLGLNVRSVDLKDIMFPGDLKKMFAQVVGARKEGLAALEKARGETAALRNLANAARMIEGNPSLIQLRLIQQIGASAGNTIVLGLPSTTTPLPVRPPEAGDREPRELPPEPETWSS